METDREELVKEANRIIKKYKHIFIMSDEGLSFMVVGVKEKNGPGSYSQFARSVDALEAAAKKVMALRKDGIKLSPPYFDNSADHEKWIASEKRRALT